MKKFINLLILILLVTGCQENLSTSLSIPKTEEYQIENTTADYYIINNNVPYFDGIDISFEYEIYSELDELGRPQVAIANIGTTLMPTESRESISSVTPPGFINVSYDIVSGGYLYNRSHLIGFQLTGENANKQNLITGTRYFNVNIMLPFENMVADYIKETNNTVLYRITPIYEGNNLVASGIIMEAQSQDKEIEFNVFAKNIQPGIEINYLDGTSKLASEDIDIQGETQNETTEETTETLSEIRGNKNSLIYHVENQRYYESMLESDNLIIFKTEQEAIDAGYRKAYQ